jgi:hypothetical protein
MDQGPRCSTEWSLEYFSSEMENEVFTYGSLRMTTVVYEG